MSIDRERAAYRYTATLSSASALLETFLKTPEMQDLFEAFYKLVNVPLAIIDLDANVLVSSRWQRICMDYHRVHPTTCAKCVESDRTLTTHIEAGQTFAMSRCPNGLTDCASPIVLDGQHVANLFVGQFLTQKPDEAWFARQATELGFDEKDYLAALEEVPIIDAAQIPRILGFLGQMTRVITTLGVERRQAFEDRTRQGLILDTIPQAVFWKDRDGRYLGCNAAFAQSEGLSAADEIVGKTDFDLAGPRDLAEMYRAHDQDVIASNQPRLHIVEEVARRDGSRAIYDVSKMPLANPGAPPYGVLGVSTDITDQLRADTLLRESEEKYRTAFMTGSDAYVIVQRDDGRIVAMNDRFVDMYGYSREECLGRTSVELGMWADANQRLDVLAQLEQHGYARDVEILAVKKNGERFHVLYSVSPLKLASGPPLYFGAIHDVTQVREQNALLRAAFMTGSDAYVVVDPTNGRMIEVSDQFLDMFGYTREECGRMTTLELGLWAQPEERAAALAAVAEHGRVRDFDAVGTRKGGARFHVNLSAMPLSNPGQPARLMVALRDVTERKSSEATLQALSDRSLLGVFAYENDAFTYVNEAAAAMFGYTREELIGASPMMVVVPEDRELVARRIQERMSGGSLTATYQLRGLRRNGAIRWIRLYVCRLVLDGRTIMQGNVLDITDAKAAEERVHALTRLLRTISDVNQLIVREHDRDHLLREACRIIVERGEMRMAWIGFADAATGDVRPAASAGVEEGYLDAAHIRFDDSEHGRGPTGTAIRERRPVVIDDWETDPTIARWRDAAREREYRSSAAFPLETRGRVVGALTTYAAVPGFFTQEMVELLVELAADLSHALNALDVETEKTVAEQALHESEERFRRIVETSAEGIWVVDADFNTTYANRRTAEILGREPAELIGHNVSEFISPGEIADHDRHVQDRRVGVPASYGRRFLRKDGRVVECAISAVPMADERGEYCGSFAMMTDVTERAASERQIRRLAAAVGELTEAIVITDPDGNIEYTNPAFTKMTGHSSAEAAGRNWFAIVSALQPAEVRENLHETIARGETWQGFLTNVRKDGTPFDEEATISPVRDAAGHIINFVAIKRDVTKERSLIAQLNQAQKLEAIGTLAGGVAHDFNNLLQGMMMMLQVARRSPSPDKITPALDEVDKLLRRGSSLTKQLLLFSRKEVAKPELLDLNDVIRDASNFLRRLVRENVTFTTDLADQLLPVTVDRSQIEQALMNLVVNAADAMPSGGSVRITTSSTADRCVAAVEDTGHGIPREIRDHIFEPFFTTKAREKGTGLGLSVVHGIVMEHGGTIAVDDRPGGGTTFTISLPRVTIGESLGATPDADELDVTKGTQQRVLVIEDEEAVRAGLVALLEYLEYQPFAVSTGEEALALPAESPFDLILTDVVLPGRPGSEIAEVLTKQWPASRVVLMSGYTGDEAIRTAVAQGKVTLLEKPFDAATLADALHRATVTDA